MFRKYEKKYRESFGNICQILKMKERDEDKGGGRHDQAVGPGHGAEGELEAGSSAQVIANCFRIFQL